MKIGSLDTQPVATPVASERKAAAPGAAAGEPSAQVALSSAATGLSTTTAADGPFDSAKVQRIAQAIRDGKFEVHPEAIADKLIANAQELLGKTAG
jgi:negative regulator of flagellin synthesis FlgM